VLTVLTVDPHGAETVAGRLDADTPDLALIDDLLRFALCCRRRGLRVRLRDAPETLRELVELAGVSGVLGLEPLREPEFGEQLGKDEVVQPGDPSV
jgi:hypothetical protein